MRTGEPGPAGSGRLRTYRDEKGQQESEREAMRKNEQLPWFPPGHGTCTNSGLERPQCWHTRGGRAYAVTLSRAMVSSYQPIAALMYENVVFPYILML